MEAIVLFQSGNTKNPPPNGNSGKGLFYYHLKVSETEVVTVKRFEFLFNKCKYINDPEDYIADVLALSQKRILVVCETDDNKIKGFLINPSEKKIFNFYFNIFNAATVKNPVLAKFDISASLFYTQKLKSGSYRTSFMMIIYTDCNVKSTVLLPEHFIKEIYFNSMYIPYPASIADEK